MVMTEQPLYRAVLKKYPDVLDMKQVCAILGVSKKTAYKWIKDNSIVSIKVGREYRVIKASLVQHFFNENAVEAANEKLNDFDEKIKMQHL